jgi:hypothetical protein
MSATRDEIVAALGKVTTPPLAPTSTAPAVMSAYNAWPVWRASTYTGRMCDPDRTWDIYVVMPSADAAETGDELADDVTVALLPVGAVQEARPEQWAVEQGQAAVPVLRIRLIT